MTNQRMTVALSLVLFAAPLALMAQPMGDPPMGGGPPGMGGPSFMRNVFPPNMVMRHQGDIGLTDDQRETIAKQMEDSQKALVALQWEVERESEKLGKLLEPARIDEAAALRQVDQVMTAEERLKKAHLALLLKIKNVLTPTQQEKLRQLRSERRGKGF